MQTSIHKERNITNPQLAEKLAQSARVYALVEDALRRAAERGKWLEYEDLSSIPDIAAMSLPWYKLRDVLRNLRERGHVLTKSQHGTNRKLHTWDLTSGAFTLTHKLKKRAAKRPSEPVIIKPEEATKPQEVVEETVNFTNVAPGLLPKDDQEKEPQEQAISHQEVELVLGGATVVIGRNAATGRIRVTIES